MKKYLFAALGAGLLMTSCQSDEPMMNGLGQEQQVSFTVSLPDAVSTRAAGGVNSAKGGVSNNVGEKVTFNVALYLVDEANNLNNLVYSAEQVVASTGNHTSATFEPTLVIGEQYRVVAYAEFDNDADQSKMNWIAAESGINNEKNDEYYVSKIMTAAPKLSAELKRPYGKLRLLAEDLKEAERQFGAEIDGVSVTYKHTRPTGFDAVQGTYVDAYTEGAQTFSAPWGEYTDGSFTVDGKTEVEGTDYHTIFVDYLPGKYDKTDSMVPFTITITFKNGKTFTRSFTQDIPVRRNWLTTLKGRLFTMDSELTLYIEENFDGETVENFDEDIEWIFANGGTITLQDDVKLKKSLIVAEDANVVLNLNGHNIVTDTTSNDLEIGDAIIVYGNLTIEGEGTVQGNTRAVWARGNYGAKVRINGGHYIGSTTADAKCEVIYASGDGVIDIYGGEFEAVNLAEGFAAPQYAVLNLYGNGKTGCDINVYGGKFKGFNPSDNISENPKKNFVEDGFVSVKVSDDTYRVMPSEITLTENMTLAGATTLNKDLTINLNGYTLDATSLDDILFRVNNGATLTIKGEGEVKTGLYVASANEGGKIVVEGGNYSCGTSCFQANGGEVYINDGEFAVRDEDKRYTLNHIDAKKNDGKIEVKGGKFLGYNPAESNSENPVMNFVADGYSSVQVDGWYVVGAAVSTVSDLEDALNNSPVVNIDKNIDNGSNVTSIRNNDVVINMAGNEIIAGGKGTNNYAFNLFGSDVEVNDANLNGAGFAVIDGSDLTVNSGTIAAKPGKSGRNMFYVVGNSTVTVNEGRYTFDRTSCYFVYVEAGSTCYINGGHFEKPLANNASKDSFVNNASAGTVIITGGTFNVDPTKWLADGYKAEKSGKIWTVSKK